MTYQLKSNMMRCWLLGCILSSVSCGDNFFTLSSRNHSRTQVWGNVCPRSDLDTPTCGWEIVLSASCKLTHAMVDGVTTTRDGQNSFLLRSTACNKNLSEITTPFCLSATLYGDFNLLVKPIIHAEWSQICNSHTYGVLEPVPYVTVYIGQMTPLDTNYFERTSNTVSSLDSMLGLCDELATVNSRSCLLLQHGDTCYSGIHRWIFPEEISLSKCSTLCTHAPLCAGFNFRKRQGKCEITSEERIFEFGQTEAGSGCDYWQVIKRR